MFKRYLVLFLLLNTAVLSNALETCDLHPGKADSYVFALSLQPGFCETSGYKQGKPECTNLKTDSIYRKEFSLHGLWPNQTACGTNYGFCSDTQQQTNFCDYAPLQLDWNVASALKNVMASYAYGSCLERHEWNKHGSCQLRRQDDYFTLAVVLVSQINDSSFKDYVIYNMGQTVSLASLQSFFDKSFGVGASKKVQFICTGGILTDLYINMPNLDKETSKNFVDLVNKADNNQPNKCSDMVKLSNFYVN